MTGGSGFVGGAVLEALRDEHDISAMARSDSAAARVVDGGAQPVITSLEGVAPHHLRDAEAVIHCAAHVEDWGPSARFQVTNVEGTNRLLAAARRAGVSRFLHVSTESVLFSGGHLRLIDEATPYPRSTPFLYAASKGDAERLVLKANDPSGGFQTIVVRPVLVWGPGDQTILPELVELAGQDRYFWLDGGRHLVSPTHITNLTHGIRLALTRGSPGQVYFITDGVHVSMREFLTRYAATAGADLPDRSIPGWLARGVGFVAEPIWRLLRLRSKPPVTRLAAALLSREITISSDKAHIELGYQPVISVEDGLRELRRA